MRLIDADAIDLDREVELADDWKTAHEIANCVKYAPTVPAVPLDKLCEFLGKATQPCILLAIGCPYDESNCEECDSCNAWKAALTKWMEEQNAR